MDILYIGEVETKLDKPPAGKIKIGISYCELAPATRNYIPVTFIIPPLRETVPAYESRGQTERGFFYKKIMREVSEILKKIEQARLLSVEESRGIVDFFRKRHEKEKLARQNKLKRYEGLILSFYDKIINDTDLDCGKCGSQLKVKMVQWNKWDHPRPYTFVCNNCNLNEKHARDRLIEVRERSKVFVYEIRDKVKKEAGYKLRFSEIYTTISGQRDFNLFRFIYKKDPPAVTTYRDVGERSKKQEQRILGHLKAIPGYKCIPQARVKYRLTGEKKSRYAIPDFVVSNEKTINIIDAKSGSSHNEEVMYLYKALFMFMDTKGRDINLHLVYDDSVWLGGDWKIKGINYCHESTFIKRLKRINHG